MTEETTNTDQVKLYESAFIVFMPKYENDENEM